MLEYRYWPKKVLSVEFYQSSGKNMLNSLKKSIQAAKALKVTSKQQGFL